ncbi:MAG: insulinase family protein, partial [Phaeodactylibacter sp.]|nr:insulinase family protein [Phaeodactylibacter sp.]
MKGLAARQLKDFHREYVTPANSFLVVVGDIEKETLEKKLSAVLSGWQGGQLKS